MNKDECYDIVYEDLFDGVVDGLTTDTLSLVESIQRMPDIWDKEDELREKVSQLAEYYLERAFDEVIEICFRGRE